MFDNPTCCGNSGDEKVSDIADKYQLCLNDGSALDHFQLWLKKKNEGYDPVQKIRLPALTGGREHSSPAPSISKQTNVGSLSQSTLPETIKGRAD